jgi:plasmid stability protein
MISFKEVVAMAQLIVRNLEEDVKTRLRQRASRHGRSVEEEVRDILRNATKGEGKRRGGIGSAMSRLFRDIGLRQDIPELKGTSPKPTGLET